MRAGRNTAALFAGTALFLLTPPTFAAESTAAAKAPTVTERVVDGTFFVEGTFEVTAPGALTWSVLSDYEHIAQFVSSLRHSVVRERSENELLVEQHALGKLLFISREMRVLLRIREDRPRTIVFKDVGQKDFELYQGDWTLLEGPAGTSVTYRLTAKPKTSLPSFIGSSVFRASASGLLAEVQAEILRRAARARSASSDCARPPDAPAERSSSCP